MMRVMSVGGRHREMVLLMQAIKTRMVKSQEKGKDSHVHVYVEMYQIQTEKFRPKQLRFLSYFGRNVAIHPKRSEAKKVIPVF